MLSLSRYGLPLALGLILVACDKQEVAEEAPAVRPVKAIQVSNVSHFGQRSFAGRAKATRELDLSFRVSGTLQELPVKIGDELQKGQEVAKLDPATYAADVEQAKATLSRTQATLDNATVQRERDKTLFDKGHVAKAKLDQSIALEGEAKADVNAARASLQKAQLDLGYTALQAPFSGVIVETYVDNFQDVRAQEPVVRLLDSTRIEMVVDIPESLISLVPNARNIKVVFDPFPNIEIPAEIKEIGTEASATTRTYPVTLIMEQPEGATILPGMAGKASGDGSAAQQSASLSVPVSATFTPADESGTYVWVIDPNSKQVKRRPIETGEVTEFGITVNDGLEDGELVVVAGVSYLRDDQQVRLLEE
ncbi:MAG: efflux RND transporter periplasmic adaptor subunit [Pseudomonadota bacterium]